MPRLIADRPAFSRSAPARSATVRLIMGLSLCLGALLAWILLMGHTPGGDPKPALNTQRAGLDVQRTDLNAFPGGPEPGSSIRRAAPLSCLSYAPYRRTGDAPWHADRPIRPEQIRADLTLLQPLTRCIRTYGVEHGLDAVPAIARELGFRVKLGVWIGGDAVGNERHLERAIALAREYRDVVDLLIVGNEVLLRGELSPQGLVRLLDKARSANVVPVAYAEVWEFWQRHAEILRGHVDVVAVHVLPYWEDEPVGVERAVEHVQAVLRTMNDVFAPLPIWLAETGWPSAGRQRGSAVPGIREQTRFMRAWLEVAPPDYNLIEAFDQPWKRDLEGAMGGHWGILDAQGQSKVSWQGPLAPNVDAAALIKALLGGLVGGGVLGAFMARGRGAQYATPSAWIAVGLLAGACVGPLVVLQIEMIALWGRSAMELTLGSLYALLGLATTLMALAFALSGQHRHRLVIGIGLLLALTVAQALTLVLDGRYRPLIWPILIAPALGLLLAWASRLRGREHGAEAHGAEGHGAETHGAAAHGAEACGAEGHGAEAYGAEGHGADLRRTGRAMPFRPELGTALILLLAGGLAVCAVTLVTIEGLHNTQAVQAGLAWVLLAVGSTLAQRAMNRDATHAHQETSHQPVIHAQPPSGA